MAFSKFILLHHPQFDHMTRHGDLLGDIVYVFLDFCIAVGTCDIGQSGMSTSKVPP